MTSIIMRHFDPQLLFYLFFRKLVEISRRDGLNIIEQDYTGSGRLNGTRLVQKVPPVVHLCFLNGSCPVSAFVAHVILKGLCDGARRSSGLAACYGGSLNCQATKAAKLVATGEFRTPEVACHP
jgi:hypothetical protein